MNSFENLILSGLLIFLFIHWIHTINAFIWFFFNLIDVWVIIDIVEIWKLILFYWFYKSTLTFLNSYSLRFCDWWFIKLYLINSRGFFIFFHPERSTHCLRISKCFSLIFRMALFIAWRGGFFS